MDWQKQHHLEADDKCRILNTAPAPESVFFMIPGSLNIHPILSARECSYFNGMSYASVAVAMGSLSDLGPLVTDLLTSCYFLGTG